MDLPKPNPQQLAWADCEVGVIIHFDLQVFESGGDLQGQRGGAPSPAVFNPSRLDTDQWVESAVAAGARYAVLVAKHGSGFSLWPTQAHSCSVAASPWRQGRGDIVGDFIRSCAKYGVRPGLYYNTNFNAFLNVDYPGRVRSGDAAAQAAYNAVVEQQLTELWSRYGDLFEIWFDGGTLAPEQGGPGIIPILARFQPDAVVFQGPPSARNLLRWVGNERGEAPDPCWATTNLLTAEDGTAEKTGMGGSPAGSRWAPGESDLPNRDQKRAFQGGWFWRAGEDDLLYSCDHLVERYYCSVGRNTNMLIGMVIDNRGLVPEADRRRFAEFGQAVAGRFARPLARAAARELDFGTEQEFNQAVVMEDIAHGERILGYDLRGVRASGETFSIATGSCIGHKRILRFPAVRAARLRLEVTAAKAPLLIRELAAYRI